MLVEVIRVEWSPSMDICAILMLNNTIEVVNYKIHLIDISHQL
jgi:hypothetical protein